MVSKEERKNLIPYDNFILWCKGWYQFVDKDKGKTYQDFLINGAMMSINLDAKNILGWEIKNNNDLLQILLINFNRYNDWCKTHGYHYLDIRTFFINFYENKQRYNLNDTASVICTIKSFFVGVYKDNLNLDKPIYNRKLYKYGFVGTHWKNGITYKSYNNLVKEIFN